MFTTAVAELVVVRTHVDNAPRATTFNRPLQARQCSLHDNFSYVSGFSRRKH